MSTQVVISLIVILAICAIASLIVWLKDRRKPKALPVALARPASVEPTVTLATPPAPPPVNPSRPQPAPPPLPTFSPPRRLPPPPPPARRDNVMHRERPGQPVFDDVLTQIMLARQAVLASEFALKPDCEAAIADALRCYNFACLAAQTNKIAEAFSLLQRAQLAAAFASANAPPLPTRTRRRAQC